MTIRVGTRASALAVAQTQTVADRMAAASGVPVELVLIESEGDRLAGSLSSLGGTGVFASALREALLDDRCDAIVHSLKDLPVAPVPGLRIGAVPGREDPRDALCARDGLGLAELPRGARVGTGSPRRRAALLARRPDLDVVDIRGNVDTRLGRVGGDLDAVVLAAAGLTRLGRLSAVTEIFDFSLMPHAPGQGALAVEVRAERSTGGASSDDLDRAILAIVDVRAEMAVAAERAVLATLEAGCAAPIGASGLVSDDLSSVEVRAVVFATDGTRSIALSATESFDPGAFIAGGASGLATGVLGGRRPRVELLATAERAGRSLAGALLSAGAAGLAPLGVRP